MTDDYLNRNKNGDQLSEASADESIELSQQEESTSDVMNIKIDQFVGPLDLLLHLIKTAKIDIHTMKMTPIVAQYLDYLKAMQLMDLEVASDYLVMAATLLEIKARELLPVAQLEDPENEDIDPKKQLIDALELYQNFKEVVPKMREYSEKRAQISGREQADLSPLQHVIPLKPGELSFTDLTDAIAKMEERLKEAQPLKRTIERETVSIEGCIKKIERAIESKYRPVYLSDIIQSSSRTQIVTYFLAMLQLVKSGQLFFIQEKQFSDIRLIKNQKAQGEQHK